MEIRRSSCALSSKLRQLMCLDSPTVVLLEKKDSSFVKAEKSDVKKVSMSEVTSWSPPTTRVPIFRCCLCTHGQRLSLLSISNPGRNDYLASLVATTDDLIFCWICRQAVTRLFNLREEVEDIEIRIRVVVQLRSQQRPFGEVLHFSSSPSFTIDLRRLMSLDVPKVFLGQRCLPIKIDEGYNSCQLVRQTNVADKQMREPRLLGSKTCSLCTHDQGLSTLSMSNHPRRETHLRSLLLGVGGDNVDLIFCSVCRQAVTKLLLQREEVQDMEIRIRTVVKLRDGFTADDALPQNPKTVFVGKTEEEGCDGGDEDSAKLDPNDDDVVGTSEGLHGQVHRRAIRSTPYECRPCEKSFKRKHRYLSHMNKVHKSKMADIDSVPPITSFQEEGSTFYRCPISMCRKTFSKYVYVFDHFRRFHGLNVSMRKICSVCKKGFLSAELFKAHSHPDKGDPTKVVYTCDICHKVFEKANILELHRNRIHLKKEVCPHCNKTFQKKESLERHSKTCSKLLDTEQRKCHCGKVFATRAERADHERVVHKGLTSLKCYFCSKVLMTEISSLFTHMRLHTLERHHICHKCGKHFGHEYIFKGHRCLKSKDQTLPSSRLPKVEKKKRHKCTECGQIFPQWIGVSNHLKKVHGLNLSKKKFCPDCKTAFLSSELFEAHIHPDKKNPRKVAYKCSLCEKLLSTPALLRRHKHEIHEKKFQVPCPNCEKVLTRPEQLEVHIRICSAEQTKCNYCGKMFETGDERFDHERVVHKGLKSYKCYFCSKIQSSSNGLDSHLRTHTLERPFVCSKCGQDFPGSGGLRTHLILVHGTDKKKIEEMRRKRRVFSVKYRASLPYRCGQCDMGFPRKVYLTRHEEKEH